MNTKRENDAEQAKKRHPETQKPKPSEKRIERRIDEAVEESFPASDPPSTSMPHRGTRIKR